MYWCMCLWVHMCGRLDNKHAPQAHVFEHLTPPLGVPSRKVMEPLGGGALQEEVCHWAWRVYSLTSLPVSYDARGSNITSQLPDLATLPSPL